MRIEARLARVLAFGAILGWGGVACDQASPLEEEGAEPPTGVSAEPVGPTAMRVRWEPLSRGDVVAYQIERRANLQGEFIKVADVAVSRTSQTKPSDYLDTDLDPETFYGYRIRTELQLGRVSAPSAVAGAQTAPAPGIEVTTETLAPAGGDANGYVIRVQGAADRSEVFAVNATRRFSPLPAGSYTVSIEDVATGCDVRGGPTQSVTVTDVGTETLSKITFHVDCQDPTRGQILVRVVTEGDTLPSPYRVRLTGIPTGDTVVVQDSSTVSALRAPGGEVSFKNLMPGDYDIDLLNVPTGVCTATPSSVAGISVTALATDTASFLVNCRRLGSGSGKPLVGRWTNAAGATITSAAPGATVFLELTARMGADSLRAFEGTLFYNPDFLTATAVADFSSGSTDQMSELTGNATGVVGQVTFTNLSISSQLSTGDLGLARITFTTGQVGTTTPSFTVAVATDKDGGAAIDFSPSIPALEVAVGGGNQPPVPDAGGPYTGAPGDTLAISGTGTTDDGTIVTYLWDFGDGSPVDSTGAEVHHVYDSVGVYTLTLAVTDDGGLTAVDSATVNIRTPGSGGPALAGVWKDAVSGTPVTAILPGNRVALELSVELPTGSLQAFQGILRYPQALLTADSAKDLNLGTSDVLTEFTGNTTVAGEIPLLSFSIASAAGSGPQGIARITFQTNQLGTVTPAFTIEVATDFGGDSVPLGVDIPTLTLGQAPPAGLQANAGGPYTAAPGDTVTLNGSGSTGGIEKYIWLFGDGSPADSSGATVKHAYASAGAYEAILTVRDTTGATSVDTASVTIGSGGGSPVAWRSVWTPGSAANGSVVKLTVSTAPGDSLRSFESVVGWDAAVLQYDSAVKRTFLSSVFTPTPQGAGQVKLVGSTKTPAAPTVETALADLYFTVIGCPPSTARTTTTGLKLFNANFQPIALTGKPIVEDTVAVTGTTCGGGSNQAPIAAPGGPYVGTPNNLVIFDGSGSRDPDGTIASYDWQFGDGTTGAGVNPGHAYTAPGTYTATLTVRDDKGATASATVGVTILNTQPPLARANGPYTGRVGQTLSFSAAGSNDPDGAIVRFDWDFGDGRTGAGPAPQHVYERAGTYTAKLTVTDNLGATASANAQVTVDIPAAFAWKNTWMLPPTPTTTAAAYAPLEGPPGSARPGDRVALKVTTRPGVPIVQAQGEIFFNPFVVRFDSVQAGARFDAFLNVTPGLPNRLQILGRSTAPLPDTLEALIATAWFTVIGLDGDSTTTQTAGVVLQNPQGQPLNLNALPVLEGTLAVEEDTFVPGNQLPAAEANGPYTGTVGNPVTFSSAGSVDPDGSIVSYAWNFGDGAAGTGPQPSHSYTAPGTYTVILAVTDNDGARATDQATVTITAGGGGNQAPTASFTNTCTALACTFDGSASSDPDGTIASWAWNFGDGGSGTGANASHTYAGAGTYTVTLTVTDNGGATAASTKSVTVAPAGPSGNLVGVWTNTSGAVITSASVGQTVKLQICSTDSSVQAFQGVLHFGATVSQGPHGDLNSVTAGKGACVGTADVMDQYTGAQNSPAPGDNSFLSFSIAAAAGAGAQGLGAFDLTLNAAGSYTPTLTVDVYTAFGGANITPVVSIPTLTVN